MTNGSKVRLGNPNEPNIDVNEDANEDDSNNGILLNLFKGITNSKISNINKLAIEQLVKVIDKTFMNIFINRLSLEYDYVYNNIILDFIKNNCTVIYENKMSQYYIKYDHVEGKFKSVLDSEYSGESLFLWNGVPYVTYTSFGKGGGVRRFNANSLISIATINGIGDSAKFIDTATKEYLKKIENNSRHYVTFIGEEDRIDDDGSDIATSYEKVLISQNRMKAIKDEVFVETDYYTEVFEYLNGWYKSKDLYNEYGMTWKTGCMLYGEPGTGKTRIVKEIAKQLDIPLYQINLNGVKNKWLINVWKNYANNAPCIYLFEDFDSIFTKRARIEKEDDYDDISNKYSPVTFDTLLNLMDGPIQYPGIITVFTTNHIERIDESIGVVSDIKIGKSVISTRPGRIDRVFNIGELTINDRIKMAKYMLGKHFSDEEIEKISYEYEHITLARFKEICKLMLFTKSGISKL